MNRLTIPDLLSLFGNTEEDDCGKHFILVDDREHLRKVHRNAGLDDIESLVGEQAGVGRN